jgi:hypothetical protein
MQEGEARREGDARPLVKKKMLASRKSLLLELPKQEKSGVASASHDAAREDPDSLTSVDPI